jgi:FkbM family methyltransferase
VSLVQAGKNILDTYKFNLQVQGDLLARVGFASRYWAYYLCSKYLRRNSRGDWASAHLFAMERLARLGFSQRLVTVKLPNGNRLEVDLLTSHLVLKEIYFDGMYESPECSPREGQVVFDIGSQQGIYTVLAAGRLGRGGKLVSIEPEPRNYLQLTKNICLNRLSNVTPLQIAISDKSGTAELNICEWNMGGHSLVEPPGGALKKVVIQMRTLDDLVASLGIQPDIIKIDVEGSVLAVLRGGLKTIKEQAPAIVLEMDSPGEAAAIRGMLVPCGYTIRLVKNILFASLPK